MKARILVYGSIVAVLIATVLIVRSQSIWEIASSQAAKAAAPVHYVPETPVVTVPDRRLAIAFDGVDRVFGGAPDVATTCAPAAEGWRLTRGDAVLDSVGDWASFESLFAILVRHARSAAAGHPLAPGGAARRPAEATSSIRTVHGADRDWAEHGPSVATLLEGTAALADLAALVPDRVGVADPLLGRALALAAVAEAVAPGRADADIALLAHVLGYRASACARAGRLAEDDPVRAFVFHDDARLASIAERKGASRRARQLRLVRLAENRDTDGWQAWLGTAFPGEHDWSLIATGMALRRFEMNTRLSGSLIAHLAAELRLFDAADAVSASTSGYGSLAGTMDAFEETLEAMKATADGVFLDREVLGAYYRDAWYSSLLLTGEHLRLALASIPATLEFANDLGEGGAPHAAEFRTCFKHLAALDTEAQDLGQLSADLKGTHHFGGLVLLRPAIELLNRGNPLDFTRRMAVVRLAARLDQRPAYRQSIGWLLRSGVDLALSEVYLAHGVDEAAPNDAALRGWWAGFQGDAEGLRAFLEEPSLTPDDAKDLLEQYAGLDGVPQDSVDARWREAIARHPADWALTGGYAKRLEDRGEPGAAREMIRDWRAAQRPEGFDDIFSRTALARCLDAEGRPVDALGVVAPAAPSMQYGAMDEYARLLEKLGRTDEADSVALVALLRYPQSPRAAVLAVGRLWRRGSYPQAAALLARTHARIPQSLWDEGVWPEFRRAFGDDRKAASAALAAMQATGMQWWVPATLLHHDGVSEPDAWIAQTLAAGVTARGQDDVARLLVVYDAMRLTSGDAQAKHWLQLQMLAKTPVERAVGYMMAYETDRTAAMWVLGPEGRNAAAIEFNWLMRACDVVQRDDHGEHRAAVDKWFAKKGETRYQTFGRYLLGLASEDDVLEHATERRARCEAYYYIGLHQELSGRYREAATWYARSFETRDRLSGEYRWSSQKLMRWGGENLSLGALARRAAQRRAGQTVPGA